MNRPTLLELAEKYSSDKLYFHSYIPKYAQYFEQKRLGCKKLLEIGIGYKDLMEPLVPKYVPGSSLLMWRDYFDGSEIYACDIREDVMINEGRIHSFICDQSNPLALYGLVSHIGGNFDIIIDDGSHQHEHQFISAATLLPYLKCGGLYVIEDVWPDKGEELAKQFNGQLWVGGKRGDDNLVIVRK